MTQTRKTSRKPTIVRYGPSKLRIAYYAGQGRSSAEIAGIVGGTPDAVRRLLSAHDLPLLRDRSHEDWLTVKWKRRDRNVLDEVAARMNREPAELAALILRKALERGPKLLLEWIDDLDVV